jgi:hypothetical protein
MDWDDLNESHYNWPAVAEVSAYRSLVKNTILNLIDQINPEITWSSDAWIIMMGIEHERIHLETSSVIIRMLCIEEIRPHEEFGDCPYYVTEVGQIPKN